MQSAKISTTSKAFLLVSLAVVAYAFIMGRILEPEIMELGMMGFIKQHQWKGSFLVFSFSFSFSLGLLLVVMARLFNSDKPYKYYVAVIVAFLMSSLLVVIWPFVVGADNSPLYFGLNGGLLLVMIFLVGWFWAKLRTTCQPSHRKIIDLRGLSYLFFALATWNMCGAVGMPGYALYPERSLEVNAYPFIIGQVKVVMLYFVLAWLSLLLSYILKQRSERQN